MTSRRNRDYIKVQLIETQKMLKLVDDHPLMSISLRKKEEDLLAQLAEIPVDSKDAKVVLLFNGLPVKGSIGIDANFIGKAILPFQLMVNSEYSYRVIGREGKRGQLNNKNASKLFLTTLPRGSFGVELSKIDSTDLFEENLMSDSLSHISRLIDSSTKSDEDFASEIGEVTPRTITSLKEFLKVIADDSAGVTIESGGVRCELSPSDVKTAYERVSGTRTDSVTISLNGVLKGMLLESWRFDFVSSEGNTIVGKIGEDISDEQVAEFITSYFNKECKATFKIETVKFSNGAEKLSYTVTGIEPHV